MITSATRLQLAIDIVTMTREKREAAATEKILNDHFSDDTDIGREDRDTAREILSGGLDHIEDTCKTILQEAKDAWGKLTGVKELQDYMERRKTQDANFSNEKGVDMFDVGEGKDRVHLRVSKNPDWYQDFYGTYGRAPNQRELYDIAQEKIIAENDKGDEESKVAIAEIEEAKKRVESIERVSETLKSLNKEDLIAQTLLDPETYEEAYKPLLEEIKAAGNGAVTKAARDSALILAKLAENFHKNYGVPLKLAMIAAGEVSPETASQLNQSAIENELQLVKEKYWNTEEWMKAPDGTLTKLTERQWLITHSETFREWFGDWETVEKVTKLYYGNPIVMTEGGFKEKLEKAARDNGINIAADADSIRKEIQPIFKSLYPGKELSKGYRELGRVKNLDGELISITVSSAKELRHHSTNPRTLFLAVNLDSVIENATFLYEEVKDESRVKKSNQTTLAYRYYATRVVVNGEECIARIIVRKDKNGNLYFYDGDITSNEQIKKDLPKYLYPDTKTGQNLGKSLFTHSIQEWLAKVKETTDKIGGNGEVLASVVNDFEESSTYHQMAGEYAHNVLSGKSTKKDMAERQLDADEKSFADSVDRFMAGKISTDTIQVMRTPLVMRLVGAEVLPVEISVSDLKKVLVDKHADITPDIMKQIPRALTDPMMIFSTYSGKNGEARKVIVLELKDENGATIVVPMELEHMSDGYKVNRMTSTYGKTDRKTGEPSYEWFKKQLEAGNLEYVNRKKATDWISTEQPDWLIPKEKVDNLLSAPNVANEEDLVKLKSENPTYYQTAADKDLVVYHNVSTGKLREAIKLGGLPMPSLAITKRDIPFGDFGEITLIGDKDVIDPRKSRSNEVFSRDAYTVRKPVVNYEVPAKIDSDAFHKKYEETRKFLNKNSIDVGEINFSFYDGEESLAAMENNIAIKYYYVKNVLKKDIPIKERTVTPPVRGERLFKEYPELIHVLKSSKVKKGDFSEVDQAARPYFDEMRQDIAMGKGLVGRSKRVLAKWTTNGHINEEGVKELLLRLSAYEEDKKKKPYKEVDRQDFVKDLRKTIEEAGIERFTAFVRSEFDSLYKDRYLWDDGKKYAFNIDNIVKLMKKYRGTNNEGPGGINYGFNSLLAFLSK